jgi:hypothetical protein
MLKGDLLHKPQKPTDLFRPIGPLPLKLAHGLVKIADETTASLRAQRLNTNSEESCVSGLRARREPKDHDVVCHVLGT